MRSLLPLFLLLGVAAVGYASLAQYPVKVGEQVKLDGKVWSRKRENNVVEIFKGGKWVNKQGKEVKSTGSKSRLVGSKFFIDNFQKADSGSYFPNDKGEAETIVHSDGTAVLGPVIEIYVQ